MPKYRYRIIPEAATELAYEMAYSARQWGRAHARAYRQGLMVAVRRIADNPYSYTEHPDLGEGRRVVIYKGNRIIYSVDEEAKMVSILGFPSVYKNL
jgi:plasmid stabilization system protein ParE